MSSIHPETGSARVTTCSYCSRVLGREYYFTCHICGATYCYIHMTKHSRSHRATTPLPVSSY